MRARCSCNLVENAYAQTQVVIIIKKDGKSSIEGPLRTEMDFWTVTFKSWLKIVVGYTHTTYGTARGISLGRPPPKQHFFSDNNQLAKRDQAHHFGIA